MSILRFELRFADGRKQVATVEGERALIGAGAHCDVRLPLDQAANEHVAVQVVGGTVRIEKRAMEPAATVNGAPFATMPITADMPLVVGTTRIFISLIDSEIKRAAPKRGGDAATPPFVQVLGLIAVAAGAYLVLPKDPPKVLPPVDLPDLFVGPPPACDMAPDQALSMAEARRSVAEADRERSPFVAKDGIQAVQAYQTAAECFRKGGDADKAAAATTVAESLRQSITLDFRARRVRLEHLLAVEDYELAMRDVRVLRTLTEGKKGPWVDWLAKMDQLVKQKVAVK
ncbi:MAG TPA: hypothetical protein VHV30_01490 [Polyangiaceae bacterium]|jgi:hypothetical protein|nr:hypothetical protein [Polyangiaceae bacterium]